MAVGYLVPSSIEECLQFLEINKGEARIVAGGTDVILHQREERLPPSCLVDVSLLPGFSRIEEKNGRVYLGAAVTHAQVTSSDLLAEKAELLTKASESVGSPQVRNVATVVGNIVNAQPAADAAVALIALEAKADLISLQGSSSINVEDMYAGLGKSRIDSTRELVTCVHFPGLAKNQGSSFMRLAPRNALSLPILNVALVVTVCNKTIEEVSIVVGPVADRPLRIREVEEKLTGLKITDPLGINDALDTVETVVNPRDSLIRGSGTYRKEIAKVLVKRAFEQALSRVKE